VVLDGRQGRLGRILRTIPVGAEPFGCAVTPDGKRLYVANFSSDSVSVVDTRADKVAETIPVGPKPRGIAIAGGDEGTSRVFVTDFLAHLRADAKPVDEQEGSDTGKLGLVTILDDAPDHHPRTVALEPVDTGFNSNGSTLDRIPPTNPSTFTFPTRAFLNLLQGIAIKGGRVYLRIPPRRRTAPSAST
jgi:YVTN family beta-propeller protein